MSLREQLRADMAAAMRSGETLRRDTLRMALSALSLVEKEQKHDATDEETLTVLVKAVKTRRDYFGLDVGIDAQHIVAASRMVSQTTGFVVQPNKAVVGANAFAHSSGIHQDGFLKHAQNYEIMNPEDVGVPSSAIVLTSRSGRAALRHRLSLLGFDFEKPELDKIYTRFLLMADARKMIHDADLKELIG